MRKLGMLIFLIPLCLAMTVRVEANNAQSLIGKKIEDFSLRDFRGKEHKLSDYADSQAMVVYFVGTECPLAKLYGPRMNRIANEFADRGLKVVGINSNRQDSITEIDAYARKHDVHFPILKDVGNEIADEFGATRTPEVFLLDKNRVVRYHGRIDAQYSFGAGVGYSSPKEKRADLSIAIDELLGGKDITVAVTEVKGCLIGRVRDVQEDSTVTYSNQIARLFQTRCVSCHREGQIAPFAMTTYDEVAGWGEMIAEVVREQRMPPWHANPEFGHFSNEDVLTSEEKEMVYTWVKNGCPEGDPKNLPDPIQYAEGWTLPREPDQVIYIADEAVEVKAEGVEDYRYYTVDPGFKEDKWVRVAECMPGNRSVVHHIIAFVRPPQAGLVDPETGDAVEEQAGLTARERRKLRRERQQKNKNRRGRRRSEDRDVAGFGFLAGFAPGTRPLDLGDGYAKKIPAGSVIVFQMHYTPNGSVQKDRSSIGLIFEDPKDVTHQLSTTNASNHGFVIPANANNHKVVARKTFQRETTLLSLFPHMHVRGKSFRYEVTYPNGSHEVLLDVPHYDFNWQNSFILAEPKLIPKGTELVCTAYFDNSEDNLANPNPDQDVRWGDQTWEEMMIGWYDVAFPVDLADNLIKKTDDSADKADENGEASE